MPDLLTHFALPFSLTAPILGPRKAFLAGMIALLPDLDALIHVHRSATHSIIILLAISVPVAVLTVKRKPELAGASAVMCLSLVSHPILDAFQTYTPVLYPLVGYSIFIDVRGSILVGGRLATHVDLSVRTTPSDFKPFTQLDGPIFASESLPIMLALILVPLAHSLYKVRNQAEKAKAAGPRVTMQSRDRSIDRSTNPIDEASLISPDDLTVVIPTLNEAEAIDKVLHELRQERYMNVLIVDGYSQDRTVEIARENGARVIHQHGAGKTGALKTAIEHVDTPYMLVMDGDHTYDPRDVKKMLPHASKYDQVIGVRTNTKSFPKLHRLGNTMINNAFNILLGAGLSDVCSGMYLLRTNVMREFELNGRGFSAEVEIAANMCTVGKVTEVPIGYRARLGKRKLATWKEGFKILGSVIGLARAYNPVFLLATIASFLALPGVAITLWQLLLRYLYGSEVWSFGTVWLGLLLLIVGLQGFTIATIALMLKRMETRTMRFLKGGSETQYASPHGSVREAIRNLDGEWRSRRSEQK